MWKSRYWLKYSFSEPCTENTSSPRGQSLDECAHKDKIILVHKKRETEWFWNPIILKLDPVSIISSIWNLWNSREHFSLNLSVRTHIVEIKSVTKIHFSSYSLCWHWVSPRSAKISLDLSGENPYWRTRYAFYRMTEYFLSRSRFSFHGVTQKPRERMIEVFGDVLNTPMLRLALPFPLIFTFTPDISKRAEL